jgi:hypothetical protein
MPLMKVFVYLPAYRKRCDYASLVPVYIKDNSGVGSQCEGPS